MSPPTLNPSLEAQLQSCIGCFHRAKRNSHSSNRLQWLLWRRRVQYIHKSIQKKKTSSHFHFPLFRLEVILDESPLPAVPFPFIFTPPSLPSPSVSSLSLIGLIETWGGEKKKKRKRRRASEVQQLYSRYTQ